MDEQTQFEGDAEDRVSRLQRERDEAQHQLRGIRPEILEFAQLMERELAEHDTDRGDSWKGMDKLECIHRIDGEIGELVHAYTPEDIASEAVDIANFAMFAALNALAGRL